VSVSAKNWHRLRPVNWTSFVKSVEINTSMKTSKTMASGTVAIALLSGCSLDFIPVHSGRVKSAQYAEKPLLRGPDAPGAFKFSWSFAAPQGYLFDPTQVEISGGALRLKEVAGAAGKREASIVAHGGPPFVALDSLTATPGPKNQGQFRFQLSPNDSAWYFFDGKKWILTGPTSSQANTPEELAAGLGKFHSEIAAGQLSLRIFLVSPTGKEPVELSAVTVQGIAPRVDGWD
jgi:hypothetical protein